DAEILAQRACHDPAAADDKFGGEAPWNFRQGAMHRHRYRPQSRPGEHHHCFVRWSATDGCDELGLPGESEAYPCELILGDRSSNDGCCSPLYDVGCRRFERAERKTCSVVVRLSGLVVADNLTEVRESLVECGHRRGGV